LGGGLYRYQKTGTLYERPVIGGHRTFRSLRTNHERSARQKMAANQVAQAKAEAGAGPSPYAPKVYVTVGEVIDRYQLDGCPDRHRQPRPILMRKAEQRHCSRLLPFFRSMNIDEVTLAQLDKYCDRRTAEMTRGAGLRTVDMELGTLSNAFVWAVRLEMIRYNPLASRRPKYAQEKHIQHCREFMASGADQLHDIARWMFTATGAPGESAAWQFLFEAFTGVRTSEALALRMDAPPGGPGHIIIDQATGAWKCLEIGRCKSGINPFVIITPEIETMLRALFNWKRARYPESPWFFPSPRKWGEQALDKTTLAHRLGEASEHFGRKFTSHGARAYYVTALGHFGYPDRDRDWPPRRSVPLDHDLWRRADQLADGRRAQDDVDPGQGRAGLEHPGSAACAGRSHCAIRLHAARPKIDHQPRRSGTRN